MTRDLWLALVSGLLGSAGHCAGMCGPLVAAVGLSAGPRLGRRGALLVQALYHAGRVTTYTAAGLAMGLAGSIVDVAGRVAGLQHAVGVVAGLLMLLLGLGAAGVLPAARRLEERLAGRVFASARGLLDGGGQGRAYALGLAMGFLPCGLSWAAFAGAAATGGPATGALYALVFGLATTPALLLVGGAATLLSARARGRLFRLGGLATAAAGLLFLLRGLGLHAL